MVSTVFGMGNDEKILGCLCKPVHWAVLNAGEVMILQELQIGEFQPRLKNFIVCL